MVSLELVPPDAKERRAFEIRAQCRGRAQSGEPSPAEEELIRSEERAKRAQEQSGASRSEEASALRLLLLTAPSTSRSTREVAHVMPTPIAMSGATGEDGERCGRHRRCAPTQPSHRSPRMQLTASAGSTGDAQIDGVP
jgi:hypothetical protein